MTDRDPATIRFLDRNGEVVAEAELFPETAGTLHVLSNEEMRKNCEARVQLVEGKAYEYRIAGGVFRITKMPGVVSRSRVTEDCGRITPGMNVGRLVLELEDPDENEVARGEVEVRSAKVGYRDDYRRMLEEITDRSVGLLHELRSPAHMYLLPDPGRAPETLAQRFAFVNSLLASRKFRDAILRITALPHLRNEPFETLRETRKGFRADRSVIRQIARGGRRIGVPAAHPLHARAATVPEHVVIRRSREVIDTPENRFVKHALTTFLLFVQKISEKLEAPESSGNSRLSGRARALEKELDDILRKPFFRDVSDLHLLPLNSPVLQRKGGYREILQAWLRFDMAARLVWSGGDDVYSAGKRDVAVLYEYWVFFKLLEIVCGLFTLAHPPAKELLEETAGGFGLKLKAGRHLSVNGFYKAKGRRLAVRFSYNRTFGGNGAAGGSNYPNAGSWTEGMRPDYTLSLWPAEFEEEEAERQELIVHVHFDAKYRIDGIREIFGTLGAESKGSGGRPEALDEEKKQQSAGRFKRADLLKMHAYRDAIRRSAGAWVIYPGDESRNWKGFHEILPGIGAFGLRPGRGETDGASGLARFIGDIAGHVCDHTTRRERSSFHTFRIHNHHGPSPDPKGSLSEMGPETWLRRTPHGETHVIVGWCKNDDHLSWIRRKGKYNFRMGARSGSLRLSPEIAGARYLLLHSYGRRAMDGLFEIKSKGPRVFSSEELLKHGYPGNPGGNFYLVFDIAPVPEFENYSWNLDMLPKRPTGRLSAWPYSTTLDQLLQHVN